MTVIVDIALALVCFSPLPSQPLECHNALVANDTPRGTFQIQHRRVRDPLYGGDVLQFKENDKEYWAIHRVWLGNPKERRLERLASKNAKDRKMTKGCINVSPQVFRMLRDCCRKSTITIK